MNLKPLTLMAAIALAAMMTGPASGQIPPLFAMSADGENSSWVSDGDGVWINQPTADTYNNYECSYLQTEALPGVLATLGPLTFDYEHHLENYYDGSAILVTIDGGATWTQVASGLEAPGTFGPYVRNCLDTFGVTATEIIRGQGDGTASIDLSGAVGPTDTFQVRLVLASDFCCVYPGWTVSNIAMAGLAMA